MKSLITTIIIIYFLVLNLNGVFSTSSKSIKKRPHVIFIVADDLGWNDVGFHGNDVIATPNIDALAYSGVILNNYYTQPLCTPSRGAFLSGMYPIHTGLQNLVIRSSEPFGLPLNLCVFPQYLKDLGYSTRLVGKWHLGFFRKEYTPTFRGFDSHYGYWTSAMDYFNYTDAYEGDGYNGYAFRRNMKVEYPKIGTYATDLFTDESVKIIYEHNPSKPLFLLLSHLAAHVGNPGARLQAPEEDIRRFSYIKDEARRVYAAMLWKLDESVGIVMKALRDKDMLKDSIIVFSTDNGGASGGFHGSASSNWPLRGNKGTLWEAGIRGSAFVWSPMLRNPGRVSMEMMHLTDWFPTLYHAIGGSESVLPQLDGVNVWESIQEESPSPRDEILINIDPTYNGASIRIGDWKLLYNPIDPVLGNPSFNGWLGPSERYHLSSSNDNIYRVQNSLAGTIVEEFMPNILKKIQLTAKDAEVLCGEIPGYATPSCDDPSSPCLFNIANDPCEYFDISKFYPSKVQLLLNKLGYYNLSAVPPGNKPKDPRSNPIYWNNTWVNWFDFIDQNPISYIY